jgi:uroporphyrinogen decarboxylase
MPDLIRHPEALGSGFRRNDGASDNNETVNMSLFARHVWDSGTLCLPIVTYPGATLVGRSVHQLVTDPAAQVAAQTALHERLQTFAVLTAMDLSAEAEAFGCSVMFSEHEPPAVTGRLITNGAAAAALAIPTPGAARTQVYLETVQRLRALPDKPLVLGGMIGPFSLASRLYGVTETLVLTIQDPHLTHQLLEKCTEFLTAYAQALKAAGAQGVIMAEPTAGLLSPRAMATYSSPYVARVAGAVNDEEFDLVYHNCAAKPDHLHAVKTTGARSFHFGPLMNLRAALDDLGPDAIVCGNLDPIQVLLQQTPDRIRTAASALLAECGHHRNFLLSSGCDVPAGVPLENVEAVFAAVASRDA